MGEQSSLVGEPWSTHLHVYSSRAIGRSTSEEEDESRFCLLPSWTLMGHSSDAGILQKHSKLSRIEVFEVQCITR